MTPTRRLVLAASDPRLAQTVQAHFARTLALNVPIVRFEDVPHLLAPDTDGDVLLVASDPSDAAAVSVVGSANGTPPKPSAASSSTTRRH